MKVFMSWSGELSKFVAFKMKKSIENIFDGEDIEIFMSSEDIMMGEDWFVKIGEELKECDCAIICITQDNINSPWINFESGAIAMHDSDKRRIIPVLIDVKLPKTSPLSHYQCSTLNPENYRKLLGDLRTWGELYQGITQKAWNKIIKDAFSELMVEIKEKLTEAIREYPEKMLEIYPTTESKIKKRTLYIGAPMASVGEGEYVMLREKVIELMSIIRNKCKIMDIYYPGEEIISADEYEGEEKAVKKNFKELKKRECMLFIYPTKIASSLLTEIGYGIALSKQLVIFTESRSNLPYILSELDKVIPKVRIYEYSRFDDIIKVIEKNDTEFFD